MDMARLGARVGWVGWGPHGTAARAGGAGRPRRSRPPPLSRRARSRAHRPTCAPPKGPDPRPACQRAPPVRPARPRPPRAPPARQAAARRRPTPPAAPTAPWRAAPGRRCWWGVQQGVASVHRDPAAGPELPVQPLQPLPVPRGERGQPSRVVRALPRPHGAEDGGQHLLGHLGVEVGHLGERQVQGHHRHPRPVHLHPPHGRTARRRGTGRVPGVRGVRQVRRVTGDSPPQGPLGEEAQLVDGGPAAVRPTRLVELPLARGRGPRGGVHVPVREGEGTGLDQPDQLFRVTGVDPARARSCRSVCLALPTLTSSRCCRPASAASMVPSSSHGLRAPAQTLPPKV